MLLLEEYGASYEIFNTIFSLDEEEFYRYNLHHITIMTNLIEYEHNNALAHILSKGVRNQRFFDRVLESANGFVKSFRSKRDYIEYLAIKFLITNQDNKEFDEQFRIYAKKVFFIEQTNARFIKGIQIINQIISDYLNKQSRFYGFVKPTYNSLLTPLAQERYELLPESMENVFAYCVQYVPKIFMYNFDLNYLKSLPDKARQVNAQRNLNDFIKGQIVDNEDINYEF